MLKLHGPVSPQWTPCPLYAIDAEIPKLDVAGSNPDPDLVKQFAPRRIRTEFLRSERPKTALSKRALFDRRVRRGFRKWACSKMRPYSHLNATTGSALHPPKRAWWTGHDA